MRFLWLAVAATMGLVGWTPSSAGQAPVETHGVVVEEAGEGSALDKAGLRPGDVVLAWERLPAPPANPEAARGTIESVFDWMGLEVEQAPRGTVKLTVRRSGENGVFEVLPGKWEATLRASMPEEILADYLRGKELIDAGELDEGIALWWKVVGVTKERLVDWRPRCWLLLRIGDARRRARQYERAHAAYVGALEVAQDPWVTVVTWRAIGRAYLHASESDKAREAHGNAQAIREKTWGESLVLATGLTDLGVLEWRRGQLDKVLEYWLRALEIRQKLAPGSLVVATSLGDLGSLAAVHGDLDLAAERLEAALEIFEQLAPGSLDLAASLNNLGNLAHRRGDLDGAAEYHERSLEIKEKLAPGSLGVAASLNNLGLLATARGFLDLAAEYHERDLEITQASMPESLEVAASLNNLGNVAFQRGDLNRATDYYERHLQICQKWASDTLCAALSLNNLGLLASARGDLDKALDHLERSLEIKQRLAPGSLDSASTMNALGLVARRRGDFDGASEHYEQALRIRQKLAPGSLDVATSRMHLGNLARARGDLDRAAEHYETSLEITRKLAPGSLDVAAGLNNLGHVASSRGELDLAAEYHERSLEIQRKLAPGSSAEAQMLHALATLRRQQKKPRLALDLLGRALEALETQVEKLGGSRDVQAGFRAERAAYFRDTIDLSLELNLPEEAFQVLERSRAQSFLAQLAERDLVFSGVPEELERRRRRIAHRYDETQAEIARLHPVEQAEEIEELLGRLQRLRWDSEDVTQEIIKASPELGALRYPEPLDLEAARQVLDPGTVMLSYSVGEEETHLFVVTREDWPEVRTLPLGEEELRAEVRIVLGLQRTRSEILYADPMRQAGERLYQALIRPAEARIAGSERILIVPDGSLHLLPFALLVRQTGGGGERAFEYLVEWKPLHSVLSATVYAELKRERRSRARGENGGVSLAAFGDPRYPSEGPDLATDRSVDVYVRSAAERGFDSAPLPYSREEVERIAALYPGGAARTFLGAEASEAQAKSVGRDARILHFATHGRYDDRMPLNSFLALTLPKEFERGRENGLLQTWEIFEDVRLDADLVVLSACESGLGGELDGEGLIGLTRAFQFAGARTVASSLWQVDDPATAELMQRFYRHLRAGKPKNEALRAAQLELIRGPVEMEDLQGRVVERDLSWPYYWAAFQLIGDWR